MPKSVSILYLNNAPLTHDLSSSCWLQCWTIHEKNPIDDASVWTPNHYITEYIQNLSYVGVVHGVRVLIGSLHVV